MLHNVLSCRRLLGKEAYLESVYTSIPRYDCPADTTTRTNTIMLHSCFGGSFCLFFSMRYRIMAYPILYFLDDGKSQRSGQLVSLDVKLREFPLTPGFAALLGAFVTTGLSTCSV